MTQVTAACAGVARLHDRRGQCVDDQTYALAARVEWLRAHGYVVLVAGSLESARDAFLENPIGAALLNCHMAGTFLIARLLKRIRPALPIIMLAAYCGVRCYQQGMVSACLGRGEPPAVLLHTLQKVLGSGTPGQMAA
ncbi:MAG TPA: response regulator [Terriglobales bacterium]|nr:response regulator [Terriglobales bacterium]